MPIDEQVALECAFLTAMRRPEYVSEYWSYCKKIGELYGEFHHFKIGYAFFVMLCVAGYREILWDVSLDDIDASQSLQELAASLPVAYAD